MKKSLVYISLLFPLGLLSQNLVPNGDFEFYTSCPTGSAQISKAVPWVDPTGATPDYFNGCAPAGFGLSVPNQGVGFWQDAHSGVGYAGLWAMQNFGGEYREYIRVQLTTPMDTGQSYNVTFYVNLYNKLKKGCNNIGAYISKTPVTTSPPNVLNYTPQILLAGNPPIVDTVNWIEISGSYVATGGEKYITIGNFKNDSSTTVQIIDTASAFDGAYYYVDDVSVSINTGINDTPKPDNSIFNVVPNPNDGNMTFKYSLKQNDIGLLKIYDLTGKLIKEAILSNNENELQLTTDSKPGIYFYQVIINNAVVKNEKIVIVQ